MIVLNQIQKTFFFSAYSSWSRMDQHQAQFSWFYLLITSYL